MNTSVPRTAVAALLLAGSLSVTAWAQQSPSTRGETANTLTGGAEAAPTDKATPGSPDSGAARSTQPQTSGSSATGNTLTGGAEGTTTDRGTPQSPATSGSAATPAGSAAGGMPQQEGMGTQQK
ncbi:hypothetical protein KTQ42_21795 [Noviherbaspirillum sp. L7-7A]|uniref:hypothetical protein n=1 Tax=Noviherbaspirillum sp. L7-7A TaxID=2850560 RepID=UPI001C2C4211|nr:hypothetical protein [Noviherbaspirillum sp. L7-7A]MBV0881913.1 hypothetical protein [Noviherbaspirillum sp. L7-7A]